MRITQAAIERLAAEAERVTGQTVLEGINRPGDGTTHYVMAESMTSTYLGSRRAGAYLLGVLTGAHPAGQVNWIDVRPDWITAIDDEYQMGSISAACTRAFRSGYEYGRTHRR